MSESKNDLKARAVDLLRARGWASVAEDLMRGVASPAAAARRVKDGILMLEQPTDADRFCLAAVEALVAAERGDVAGAQPAAPTELARAIAALAEARARCDELREQIAESEQARRASDVERDRTQSTLDEALAIQSQIWDAIGGQREGESLVDAVRRVVGDTKEASVSNQNDAGQRRTGFDASAQWVSRSRVSEANGAPSTTTFEQVHHALRFRPELQARFDVEAKRTIDEAREAGRAEAQAEIERLRAVVFEFQRATGVLRPEWAKMRLESYESCDTDSLRHECRGCGRPISWEGACSSGACGSAAPPYPYGRGGKNDPLSVVANAPTVSASEGPGEAGPGCGGTETAGAGESVARGADDARLRRELESVVTAHAAESEAWVKATGASSPDEAEADANRDGETWEKQRVEIAFLRNVLAKRVAEIDSLHHQLSTAKTARDKARSERSRSDDALKAIEEALRRAGRDPDRWGSLVECVNVTLERLLGVEGSEARLAALDRRWMEATGSETPEQFTTREADQERAPQAGDVVLHYWDRVEEPAIVRRVRADGSLDLWVTDEKTPFAFGATKYEPSKPRLNNTWRFRD